LKNRSLFTASGLVTPSASSSALRATADADGYRCSPYGLTQTLIRYAASLQARRAAAPHTVFPALVFPLGTPFPRRPFQKGIPPRGKPIRGTTAQASFCLEVAALRVGAVTPPLSQAPQPPGKSLFRPFYELSPELHPSCFLLRSSSYGGHVGGVEDRTFTARLRRTRSLTGKEKPEFPRRYFATLRSANKRR
jgi:hypothetical protein